MRCFVSAASIHAYRHRPRLAFASVRGGITQRWCASRATPALALSASSVYARLAARLHCSDPCTPNEALQLLCAPFSVYEHIDVVQRLVSILAGNACCLDPAQCLALLEQLLDPPLPCGLHAYVAEMNAEERHDVETASATAAAVRVALFPLYETLLRCVAVHVQMQLEDHSSAACLPTDYSALWNVRFLSRSADSCKEVCALPASAQPPASFSLLRAAAIMIAFTAQHHSLAMPGSFGGARMRGGLVWHHFCLTRVAYPVLQSALETSQEHLQQRRPAARARQNSGLLGASQRCWWWCVLVCRAAPTAPSRILRSFMVRSLIDALVAVHRCHLTESAGSQRCVPPLHATSTTGKQTLQQRMRGLDVLAWLLLDSLPIINDSEGGDSEKGSTRADIAGTPAAPHSRTQEPLWTTELRHALLVLARDFTTEVCSIAESGETAEGARLVEHATSVAFRLALQAAACRQRRCTENRTLASVHPGVKQPKGRGVRKDGGDGVPLLTEMDLVGLLVTSVISKQLVVIDSLPKCPSQGLSSASLAAALSPQIVSISESTWCKLTCLWRLVGQRSVSQEQRPALSLTASQEGRVCHDAAPPLQLLRVALRHLVSHTGFIMGGMQRCKPHGAAAVELNAGKEACMSEAESQRPRSLEFLLVLLQSCRAWPSALVTVLEEERCGSGIGPLNTQTALLAAAVLPKYPTNCDGEAAAGTVSTSHEESGRVAELQSLPSKSAASSAHVCSDMDGDRDSVAGAAYHRLSLSITEAWASALDVQHDCDPVDVCACWSALCAEAISTAHGHTSTADASEGEAALQSCVHLPSQSQRVTDCSRRTRLLTRAVTACTHRVAYQCGDWLRLARTAVYTGVCSAPMRIHEQRSRLLEGAAGVSCLREHLSGCDECTECDVQDLNKAWRPRWLPPFISYVARRLLEAHLCNASASPSSTSAHHGGTLSTDTAHLPVSESVLDDLRRSIASVPPIELHFYRLMIISSFVEWCDAAQLHLGWCSVSAEDCSSSGDACERTSVARSPWWALTVEGHVSASGLQCHSSSVAALVFLWSQGSVGAGDVGPLPPRSSPLSHSSDPSRTSSVSAVHPLQGREMHSAAQRHAAPLPCSSDGTLLSPTEGQALATELHGAQQPWLHQAISEWTHRYSLRLLLFHAEEQRWQRIRIAATEKQRFSHSKVADPSAVLSGALGVCQRAATRRSNGPASLPSVPPTSFCRRSNALVFHRQNDALRLILPELALKLTSVMRRLCVDLASARPPQRYRARSVERDARQEVARLLVGPSRFYALDCGRGTSSRSLASHLWAAVREEGAVSSTAPGVHSPSCLSLCHPPLQPSVALSDPVRQLESTAQALGLAAPDSAGEPARSAAGAAQNAATVNDCYALLISLCATPTPAFLTSPCLRDMADNMLWRTCWTELVHAFRCLHDNRHRRTCEPLRALGSAADDSDGELCRWRAWDRRPTTQAAELDALVTCRVSLLAVRQLHLLAQEWLEYLCREYVPALRDTSQRLGCLVSTPVEALARQLEVPQQAGAVFQSTLPRTPSCCSGVASSAQAASVVARSQFFSSAAVRAYEVLCLRRFGEDERRAPCAWQMWMHELAQDDAALRMHPLVYRRSRLVDRGT